VQEKIFFKLCLALGVLGVVSCSSQSAWWNDGEYEYTEDTVETSYVDAQSEPEFFVEDPSEAAKIFNKRVPALNSLIVCRDKQCAPAELSQSKEYIYNALTHLIDNNLDTTALLCEANAQAHVCVNPYLTVPAKVGVTPAYVYLDGVKFIDATTVKGRTAIDLVLGYNLSYNGQTPTVCKPDTSLLYVKNNNSIVLNGKGFKCDMTSVGTTTIRVMFAIDYVDLDYGYLGGYYTIGLSGPAYGGGSGYGMIRLIKDAHPLSPNLKAPKKTAQKAGNETAFRPLTSAPNSVAVAAPTEVKTPVAPQAPMVPQAAMVPQIPMASQISMEQQNTQMPQDSMAPQAPIVQQAPTLAPGSVTYAPQPVMMPMMPVVPVVPVVPCVSAPCVPQETMPVQNLQSDVIDVDNQASQGFGNVAHPTSPADDKQKVDSSLVPNPRKINASQNQQFEEIYADDLDEYMK